MTREEIAYIEALILKLLHKDPRTARWLMDQLRAAMRSEAQP